MRRILSLRKHHYIARVGIVLIAIALIVGTLSCGPATKYSLTMAVNPASSGTAQDLTGTSPYAANTKVDIKATALGSYTFVKWTAPAGTFANPNAATTTFTMPAQNVTATANFVGPLDHFKCYGVDNATSVGKNVTLTDQFISINATVGEAVAFANPTEKVYGQMTTLISNPDHHLTFYMITYVGEPGAWYVEVKNQFGTYNLTVFGPIALLVPTQKLVPGGHQPPLSLDHYLLYEVDNGPLVDVSVGLKDEFGNDPSAVVGQAILFANPVQKTLGTTVTNITHPDEHLVFYGISGCNASYQQVNVVNQFNAQTQTLNLGDDPAVLLGVPSEKLSFAPVLDHFTCYPLAQGAPVDKVVHLKDQFVDIDATVMYPVEFCNPAEKWHGAEHRWILQPDYHLTVYSLEGVTPHMWYVEFQNQFGPQSMYVYGPTFLAVPTQKLFPILHAPPVGLDHYLIYEVAGVSPLQESVSLTDEFVTDDYVTVSNATAFANPVQKTVDGVVTPIENPKEHLVFYWISGDPVTYPPVVQVANQFLVGPTYYDLTDRANMLAVPSLKLYWEPIS